jgi:hypothetical protein
MEAMRSTWTDSRLDDLNGRVSELSSRIDKLHHVMVQGFVAMAGTMVVGFLTMATLIVATGH